METSAPLTPSTWQDSLMESAADSPAKTSPVQEKGQVSPENEADSGKSLPASSEKPARRGRSSKTAQCCELADWKSSWKTLPRSGTMRNGQLIERQMLVPLTGGTACGFLPTPRATDGTHGGPNQTQAGKPSLANIANHWPTPTKAAIGNSVNLRCSGDGRAKPNKLGWAVADHTWPTPRKCSAMAATLSDATFPNLETVVFRRWQTPTKNNTKESASNPAEFARNSTTLTAQAAGGLQTQPTYLNHKWVAWLMGWPIHYFDGIESMPLPLLAMAGFRSRRQRRSVNSGIGLTSDAR